MFDLWGFLLQTLTVSGVAVLLLIIKALFKDKLPPKWHFAVWGVLGMMILIPAGWKGRYTLIHWQFVVEGIKTWVGDYSVTRVLFPVPVLTALPKTLPQWLFAGYVFGVVFCALKYLLSFLRLCLVLRGGSTPREEEMARIGQIAAEQKVKVRRVVAVSGLPSAFVCGILRPVLVLPENAVIDRKILLHELLHLKNKDTLWSMVICLLRCLHWCNPLVVYCAKQALNDMEARCDQYVLEQLEGEERRAYGEILLSMVNDRFANTPGSTSIHNGGKNIRARIEAIARFKQYPAGMGLVSVCVALILGLSLITGVQASEVHQSYGNNIWASLASARSTPCTTYAGAFDAYGKAVLGQNGIYRVMCAPESMQEEIIGEVAEKERSGIFPSWGSGLNEWPNTQGGYFIYNLKQREKNVYEGLLVVRVNYPPNGLPAEEGKMYLAVQTLRVEKEKGRWVAVPLEDFRNVEALDQRLEWGCMELPGVLYTGVIGDFRVEANVQTIYSVENTTQNQSDFESILTNPVFLNTTPKPDAVFTRAARIQNEGLTHLGTAEDRAKIERLGFSIAPVYAGEKRPEHLTVATGENTGGNSNNGKSWSSRKMEAGWGPAVSFSGGGGTFDPQREAALPEYFVADLYVNDALVGREDLWNDGLQ